ncbi:Hypothetical predicted protein [Octopus vulgaris]|uniref:Uncharacterized protein n=1 Tax=Octopus vulgaris TaxID=6645 RepID=A0AA36BKA2_OCTVU|nr:Hypothetical predicted protein [Octopus vulgaris]
MIETLCLIDTHPATSFLRNCLRSLLTDGLSDIDYIIRLYPELICNVRVGSAGSQQARKPVKFASLGLCSTLELALLAYRTSVSHSRTLIDVIFQGIAKPDVAQELVSALANLPLEGLVVPQNRDARRNWDDTRFNIVVLCILDIKIHIS